jgi:hypothetical protein
MDQRDGIRGLEPENSTQSSYAWKYPVLHGLWVRGSAARRLNIRGAEVDFRKHSRGRSYQAIRYRCARGRTIERSNSVGQVPADLEALS